MPAESLDPYWYIQIIRGHWPNVLCEDDGQFLMAGRHLTFAECRQWLKRVKGRPGPMTSTYGRLADGHRIHIERGIHRITVHSQRVSAGQLPTIYTHEDTRMNYEVNYNDGQGWRPASWPQVKRALDSAYGEKSAEHRNVKNGQTVSTSYAQWKKK